MSDARTRNRASGKATFFVILNCPMIDWSLANLRPFSRVRIVSVAASGIGVSWVW